VLALAEGGPRAAPIAFATRAEREEFEHLWEHALAIARVIVGETEA